MRPLAIWLLTVVTFALAPGSLAHPNLGAFRLYVSITGVGGVRLASGFVGNGSVVRCTTQVCPGHAAFTVVGNHATVSAIPARGWKLLAWHGSCTGRKLTCTVHFNRDAYVTAVFAPTVPGLARSNPVPLGTAATIADGFRLRVVSVTPYARLPYPPPNGAEYFVANIAATYVGGGAGDLAPLYNNLEAIGAQNVAYNTSENGCPNFGPAPVFPVGGQLVSGQTRAGNICWVIARNDVASLELFIGSGFTHTTWFALH